MKKPRRKRKSKLYRTLEQGNLFFNLCLSIWFLGLWVIFGSIIKPLFSFKIGLLIYFSISSFLFLNFASKIMDIGTEYFRETLAEKILRENLPKKISKPKP
jgi:hypothetical protein